MSRRGFGRRRTVLQLEDTPQKRESYGFGYKPSSDKPKEGTCGIGALDMMTHYEDSGDEEEQEEEGTNSTSSVLCVQKFVVSSERLEPASHTEAPTQSKVTNGRSMSPDTTKPSKVKDEIDSKVMDFLAELETIDGPDTTSGDAIDGDPLPVMSEDSSDPDALDDKGPQPPTEPTTEWQQCLDEGTQCYYYWHFVTNEVTWEIPAEYSQYLLQYKEYEDALAKYEKEKTEWEKTKSHMLTKKKKKKKVESLVPYTESSHSDEIAAKSQPEAPNSSSKQECTSGVPKTSVELPKVGTLSTDSSELPSSNHVQLNQTTQQPQVESGQLAADSVVMAQLPESTVESSVLIGPQLPTSVATSSEAVIKTAVIGPELPSSSSPADKLTNGGKDKSDDNDSLFGDDIDVDEYVHRKLEEPVQSRSESLKRRCDIPQTDVNDSKPTDDDDLELDLDDIDRELEKALERKKAEICSKSAGSIQMKRKAPTDEHLFTDSSHHSKKKKVNGNTGSLGEHLMPLKCSMSRIHKDDIKKKVNCLAEVTELSNLVTDKLDFLEVSDTGLSKLQVLMIQVETRIEDWKCGGLNTEHFLRKLQKANEQLEQYEASAAPSGWSCHWDSKFKRYFYYNKTTEETQWDYPADAVQSSEPQQSYCDPALPKEQLPQAVDLPSTSISIQDSYAQHVLYDPQLFAQPPPPPPPPPPEDSEPSGSKLVPYQITAEEDGTHQERSNGSVAQSYPWSDLPQTDSVQEPSFVGPLQHKETSECCQKLSCPSQLSVSSENDLLLNSSETRSRMPRSAITTEQVPSGHGVPHTSRPVPSPCQSDHVLIPPGTHTSDVSSISQQEVISVPHLSQAQVDVSSKSSHDVVDSRCRSDEDIDGIAMIDDGASDGYSERRDSGGLSGKMAHISAKPVICQRETGPVMLSYPSVVPKTDTALDDSRSTTTSSEHTEGNVQCTITQTSSTSSKTPETSTETSTTIISGKEKKKKKKDKALVGGGLYMKKKNVSGLVEKWQKVQKDVETELAKEEKVVKKMEQELAALNST